MSDKITVKICLLTLELINPLSLIVGNENIIAFAGLLCKVNIYDIPGLDNRVNFSADIFGNF